MQSLQGNFTVFALAVRGEGHVCCVPTHHCDVELAHVKVNIVVAPKGKLAEELLMLAGEKFYICTILKISSISVQTY